MRKVFNESTLEQEFDKNGFVPISLLNPSGLGELSAILENLKEEGEKGMDEIKSSYKLSFFSSDTAYRKKVFEQLGNFFQEKIDKFLFRYKPLIVNIFDKEPDQGEVPVHQNWTFVDESKFTSVSIWIPLTDVSRENGTLEVVRGSHKVLTKYRGPSIPWVFEDLIDQLKEKYLEPINLQAGEAVILDDSIIHWSSENKTGNNRLAVQLIMIPEEATPIYYYRSSDPHAEQLQVFEVDSDFFTRFNMNEKPEDIKSIGYIDFQPKKFNEDELVKKISINNPTIKELV